MPTLKHRMNISLPADIDEMVKILAQRDDVPQATKALHLLTLALEIEEDDLFNAVAAKRDKKGAKFVSHTNAWR